MRKLTRNQQNVLSCLTENNQQLKDICNSYAKIMAKHGLNPRGCDWSSEVSYTLNCLIKKGLVTYEFRGMYALNNTKNAKD